MRIHSVVVDGFYSAVVNPNYIMFEGSLYLSSLFSPSTILYTRVSSHVVFNIMLLENKSTFIFYNYRLLIGGSHLESIQRTPSQEEQYGFATLNR